MQIQLKAESLRHKANTKYSGTLNANEKYRIHIMPNANDNFE